MTTPAKPPQPPDVKPFSSSLEHLISELGRLELLARRTVARARRDGGEARLEGAVRSWSAQLEARRAASLREGVALRLSALVARFRLSPLERDLLLVGLAPELNACFPTLLACLSEGTVPRYAGVDTALGLLCDTGEAQRAAHERLSPSAPLRRHGLLQVFGEPSQLQATWPSACYKVEERVVAFLLGSDEPDVRLVGLAQPVRPRAGLAAARISGAVRRQFAALARQCAHLGEGPLLQLQGVSALGRAAAEALCGELGRALLVVDGHALDSLPEGATEEAVRWVLREALLLDAAVCWDGVDALLSGAAGVRAWFLQALQARPGLTFLAGTVPWEPAGTLGIRPLLRVELGPPEPLERSRL